MWRRRSRSPTGSPLASLLLVLGCVATGRSLRFSLRDHGFLAALGLLMICVNYNLIYWAERIVVSGLVAVVFSTIVFMTPIGMRMAFGVPMRPRLLAAAALGVTRRRAPVPAGARCGRTVAAARRSASLLVLGATRSPARRAT